MRTFWKQLTKILSFASEGASSYEMWPQILQGMSGRAHWKTAKSRSVFNLPGRQTESGSRPERKILSLAIRCTNDGCKWTEELKNKKVHLESCPFQQVEFSNNNCHERIQRRHPIKQHENDECPWRILQSTYCSEPHPECKIQYHIRQCSKFPVTCPKSCGRSIPRETVQRRERECHLQSAMRVHLE